LAPESCSSANPWSIGTCVRPAADPDLGKPLNPPRPKANERRQPDFDREAYRQRNIIERMINRLKNFRRIATRYEKRATNYLAMITIGAILLWI
jgi:transposase